MDLRLRALISHYYRVQPAIETNTATEVAGHQHGRHIPQSKVAAGQVAEPWYGGRFRQRFRIAGTNTYWKSASI
jgi:hypothetical protein